jgi:hypothetical protein
MEKQINSMVAGIVSNDIGLDSNINDDRGSGLKFGVVRLAVVCLFAVALSPSMTQAQASAGVPVIKITKEDSSIKFNVKASVAIDGTFDFEGEAIKVRSATPRTFSCGYNLDLFTVRAEQSVQT